LFNETAKLILCLVAGYQSGPSSSGSSGDNTSP